MPFLHQITQFINDTLKAGSLNKVKLQPARYFGIAEVITRKTDSGPLEMLPAIVQDGTIKNIISPDSKIALQLYHKVIGNTYSYEKRSYGDANDIRSSTEMTMVVIYNSKLTGNAKHVLEPVVLFGLPQQTSTALNASLKIIKCAVAPVSSNMDAVSVYKQEYPNAEYFLNEFLSMFSIRYKIEMTFGQACINACLC